MLKEGFNVKNEDFLLEIVWLVRFFFIIFATVFSTIGEFVEAFEY